MVDCFTICFRDFNCCFDGALGVCGVVCLFVVFVEYILFVVDTYLATVSCMFVLVCLVFYLGSLVWVPCVNLGFGHGCCL